MKPKPSGLGAVTCITTICLRRSDHVLRKEPRCVRVARRWRRQRCPNDYQRRRGDTVLAVLESLRLADPEILDFGCGTGWFTAELSRLGRATGIDLSEGAIAQAKATYPHIPFIAANLFETSFPAERFDVVVSQEVLAHGQTRVERPQKFEMRRRHRGLKGFRGLPVVLAHHHLADRHAVGLQRFQPPEATPMVGDGRFTQKPLEQGFVVPFEPNEAGRKRITDEPVQHPT